MQQAAHKEPARHPEVIATVTRDGARTVQLLGAWDVRALESDARTLQAALQDAARVSEARWDLSQVQRFDHIGALLVWRAWGRCRPNDLLLRREDEVFFGDCETAGAAGRSTQRFDPLAPVIALGPVVCSVLVAGRSGSAMTAQLGVMRVTEELDALSVMGISHSLRLILPKMAAIAVALPLLVLWTSAVALLGGAVSAKLELGMST